MWSGMCKSKTSLGEVSEEPSWKIENMVATFHETITNINKHISLISSGWCYNCDPNKGVSSTDRWGYCKLLGGTASVSTASADWWSQSCSWYQKTPREWVRSNSVILPQIVHLRVFLPRLGCFQSGVDLSLQCWPSQHEGQCYQGCPTK